MSIKGNLDGWGWKDKVICVPFNLLEGRKLFFKFRNRTELSTLLHDELHKVWNMLHGSLYHKSVKIVKCSSGWRIKTKKNYKPIGRTHLMTTPVREEPSKLARYFPLLPHLARGQGWERQELIWRCKSLLCCCVSQKACCSPGPPPFVIRLHHALYCLWVTPLEEGPSPSSCWTAGD